MVIFGIYVRFLGCILFENYHGGNSTWEYFRVNNPPSKCGSRKVGKAIWEKDVQSLHLSQRFVERLLVRNHFKIIFAGLCVSWWANEQPGWPFPTKWGANERQGGGWAPTRWFRLVNYSDARHVNIKHFHPQANTLNISISANLFSWR